MKAVAQLNKDFARVDIVRAAEGEAVVEEDASAAERKIGEAAVDAPAAKRELIGISEINLAAVVKARRAQNEFPAANARAPDGDGDENRRVVEIVVVKEIIGASEEVIGV